MIKKLLLMSCALVSLAANAIGFTFADYNATTKTCTLTGWTGTLTSETRLNVPAQCSYQNAIYTVTAIADHALDNLTSVTEIVIPAGVTRIGGLVAEGDGTTNQYQIGNCNNFNNCPNLVRFLVNADNVLFRANGLGLLMSEDLTIVVKVPQKVTTSSGTLSLPSSTKSIAPMAFDENTSITTLYINPECTMSNYQSAGFNRMAALKEFTTSGTSSHTKVVNGILYDKKQEVIYSCPPKKQLTSLALPTSINRIVEEAFANTTNLYKVEMPSGLKTIGKQAFYKSGITDMTIPASVTALAEGAFRSCPRLTKLTIQSSTRIPDNFARDCTQLTTLTFTGTDIDIWKCAFKDCHKLANVNFSTRLKMEHDSIFAGCGFKDIVFAESTHAGDYDLGTAIFASCSYLETIDMSAVKLTPTSSRPQPAFGVPLAFVTDCPKLNKVVFNPFTAFYAGSSNNPTFAPNFGNNSPVETLVFGSISLVEGHNVICYTTAGHTPKVYMRTTDDTVKKWPMNKIFTADGYGSFSPTFYCEAYSMEIEGKPMNYFCPQATYYVPGNAPSYDNISGSIKSLKKMFDYRNVNKAGKFRLNLSRYIAELDFSKVVINGNTEIAIPSPYYGYIETDINYDDVNSVTVYYTVNGIEMKTVYPKPESTGLTTVEADDENSLSISVDGRTVALSDVATYQVFDLRGVSVASGRGDEINLSDATAGVYVVRATTADGKNTVKKITLK